VAVGADHARHHIPYRHAVTHLRDGGFIVLPEYLQRAVLKLRGLGPRRSDVVGRCACFAGKMFLPRRVSISAPRRHGTLTGALDPASGVDAGCEA
jgi:hypothetical protein